MDGRPMKAYTVIALIMAVIGAFFLVYGTVDWILPGGGYDDASLASMGFAMVVLFVPLTFLSRWVEKRFPD